MARIHPELHHIGDARAYDRAYRLKRSKEFRAARLNYRGKPLKRKIQPRLAGLTGTKRHVVANQLRAERFMEQGLTWRGKQRKRKISLRLLWEKFKEENLNERTIE